MAFDTRAVTRGARQPRAGVLTTIGARTGTERTNSVGWFPGTDDSWLIVASASGCTERSVTRHGGG